VARRKKDPGPDPLSDALRAGWTSARQLYAHLAGGGRPAPLPPGPVRLEPGETGHAEGILGYARYYGTSVSYRQNSSLWFGSTGFVLAGMAAESMSNSAARNRAHAAAAPQWRDRANVRTLLTDRRFLCDYGGRWLSFWHKGVAEFHGDLSQWMFVLRYQVGEPLMLHGPAAPWIAVCAAYLIYGADSLRLPILAPLAAGQVIPGQAIPGQILSAQDLPAQDRPALPPA
jgi:hypothetical protein